MMNFYKWALLVLCAVFSISGCSQEREISQMSADLWAKDLNYLSKKVNGEFAAFTQASKTDFNNQIEKLQSKLATLENHEVIIEMNQLIAALNDGHTELNLLQEKVGFNRMPLRLYYFGQELWVIAASKPYESLLGGQIIALNNVPVEEIHQKVIPLLAHDNEMEFQLEVPNYITALEVLAYLGIQGNDPSGVLVSLSINGTIEQVMVEGISYPDYQQVNWLRARDLENPPLYLQHQNQTYWHDWIEAHQLMYYKINRFQNGKPQKSLKKYTQTVFEAVDQKKASTLVIDLRLNRGGNYQLGLSILKNILKRPTINQEGHLYVITDRFTFSAAGHIATLLKQRAKATIIGEQSRDNPNGSDNYEEYQLPYSGISFGVCDKVKVHFPELKTPYLPVDIVIPTSFDQYVKGEDPVVNYLLER